MSGDFRLGSWVVRPSLNTVESNDKTTRLEPKVMEVLVCLADHAGEVVAKDRLIRAVWADTFVTDDVLTRSIYELRQVFEENGRDSRVIQTIPKRGYRLVAEIKPITGRRYNRLWLVILGAAAVVSAIVVAVALWSPPPVIKSIAVLPFKSLSSDPAEEDFAAGITYAVTNQLAQIGALRVISYRSAMSYKDTKKSLREIALDLKVDAVVEGAIMRSGGRTRLEVQLIDARVDRHLWARDFRIDQNNVIGLAGESARQIAAVFRVKLTPQEEARLARSATSNPSAYETYLKGRYFWAKWTSSNWQRAAEYFQHAIELDPNYPDAYVGLADCYILMASYGAVSAHLYMPQAKAALQKALTLDDDLGEAHFSLAFVHTFYDYDWTGAAREFRRGLELNPGYATGHMWYSAYLSALGHHDEAIAAQKRALELDPVSLVVNMNLGRSYYFARQADLAIQQLRATLVLDANFPIAHFWLSNAYEMKGAEREAITEEEEWMRLFGASDSAADLERVYSSEGSSGVRRWHFEQSLRDVKEGHEEAESVAEAYAAIGNNDEAFAWLDKAYNSREATLVFLKSWPNFDKLRSDSRYSDLLRRMGLPE